MIENENLGDNFPVINYYNSLHAYNRKNCVEIIFIEETFGEITKNDFLDLQIDIALYNKYNNID